ncbi:MAG: lipoprotein [Alcanivoracaceae bacterium]|nr:lipoprotein [Alcanivoracaceae bacterium]
MKNAMLLQRGNAMRLTALMFFSVLLSCVSACGQKGDLYFAPEPPPVVESKGETPPPEQATKTEVEEVKKTPDADKKEGEQQAPNKE